MGLTSLSLGHITSEQLQLALEYQRKNGGRIGEVLIALGFANQAHVTAALITVGISCAITAKSEIVFVTPDSNPIDGALSMLPIHFVAQTNKLVIGFAELIESPHLSTIETMLGCIGGSLLHNP